MHSIQVAAEKSGLTADVIRVWERRYKAICPARTESNQRVYSNDDIYRLILLRKVTESGKRIGSVANLSLEELESLASDVEIAKEIATEKETQESRSHNYLETCLNDIIALDSWLLERHLQQALIEMGLVAFLNELVHPLLVKVGNLWQKGNIRTCQEHLTSAVVRSFLGRFIISSNTDKNGPRIVVCTPPNHYHELGATMAAVTAATRGWQTVYLGPSVPVEEVVFAADCKDAAVIALSVSFPVPDPAIPDYLQDLHQLAPANTRVLIGGASHQHYADTIQQLSFIPVGDLSHLSVLLDGIREQISPKYSR